MTRYVEDNCYDFIEGKSVRTLHRGQKVTVLDCKLNEGSSSGVHTLVKTDKGDEHWISSHLLTKEDYL